MAWRTFVRACLISPLLLPTAATALVVEIQGVRLEPEESGASCVDISGVYPGVRIESDRPGQTPRVCHNAGRVNSVGIANATLIASSPLKKGVVIKFEHEFPPGVNGKIVARTKLQGFFATANGVGVPTGDSLTLKALFAQGRSSDLIAEPLEFTVGDSMESALFDFSGKKRYLVAGPRALKGEIRVSFTGIGHKVTFPEKSLIALDTGATFEDKLETLDAGGEAVDEAPDGTDADVAPRGDAKPEAPAKLPPFPNLPPLNPPIH
jgi:hypothetical protein